MYKLGLFLIIGLCSCTFAGDPHPLLEPGFLLGLWHGSVVFVAAILQLFIDVKIIYSGDLNFSYKLGFLIGMLGLSWSFGWIAAVISIVFYLT